MSFRARFLTRRNLSDKKLYSGLKNILGFYPGNLGLYKLAFRHKSAAQEIKQGVKDSNERLEFLGDAILGAVIADFLFKKFPYRDEGFLTKLRSKLVSRSHINYLSTKLGIDKLIESEVDNPRMFKSIKGDALEAFIGAIYLDKGYKKATEFILERVIKYHVDLDEMEAKEVDFKSRLIEWAQKERKKLVFEIIAETGKGFDKFYTINAVVDGEVLGEGKGHSKKGAEQQAAEIACRKVGEISLD